jgi:hypothetical protein
MQANPMVFLEIYDDGKLFWVTREYYWDSSVEMRQKTDAEYADDLVQFIGPGDGAKVLIDPSAASFIVRPRCTNAEFGTSMPTMKLMRGFASRRWY